MELLPPAAAEKLRHLRQRRDDARAVIPEFEDVRTASMARMEAQNALTRLTSHPQDGGFGLTAESRSVTEAERTLDKASADFERLKQLQEVRSAAWQASSAALAACEAWLREHGTALEAVEIEPPKLLKGEAVIDAVERFRRRVKELKADLHRIESAPYPSSFAKQRLRGMVEQLAARAVPDVTMLIEHDGDLIWPSLRVQAEVHGVQRALAFHAATDTIGLLAWLMKDTLIKRLDAEIDAEADDKAALSLEAREKATAEIQANVLAQERLEAELVWLAQADNLRVHHRPDCNPLAILGCRLVTPAAPNSQEPSSWMHSWTVTRPGGR
jgi:hypothetical protein